MYDPDLSEQRRLQERREQEPAPPDILERRAAWLVSGSAVIAMAALWAFGVVGHLDGLSGIVVAIAFALATRVSFEVGGGFTSPVQLAFVPLLFAVPAQIVPPVVVAALICARLPAVVTGAASPARLVFCFANAWFAIGAAVALIAIGGSDQVIAHPWLALVVFGSQFLADFGASALRELIVRGASLRQQLREASWVYGVDAALTPAPLWLIIEGASPTVSVLVVLSLLGLLVTFSRERAKRLDGLFELNNAYHGTALLLGDVVEADDAYTGEHCKGVVQLALEVGQVVGLGADRLRNLEFSALLHDVGKVAIPKEIINKPGKLDPGEWEIIKTHTIEGQKMLDRIGGFMGEVGRIVRSHHERWDGGGYPDGLVAEAIPIEARIVTACDSFSAMTTTRSYREAMSADDAIAELRANAGTQFDPAVVTALIATVECSDRSLTQTSHQISLAAA